MPEDVKSIPMPRDTPPPIPKEVLDKWYQKRRERMGHGNTGGRGTNANNTPLGENARIPEGERMATSNRPAAEVKTIYEAKPVLRDLRKEAVSFVPAAVRAKLDKSKGVGGLVEPEEADRLEKEGYIKAPAPVEADSDGGAGSDNASVQPRSRNVVMEEVEDEDG